MDVRALVIVGGAEGTLAEVATGAPIALLDILGRSVVDRVVERLRRYGIDDATVVSEHAEPARRLHRVPWIQTQNSYPWHVAQRVFVDLAQSGAELIVIVRVGAYAELDYENLLQFHLDQGNRVTSVVEPTSEMIGITVVNASRRNDAAYMLRHRLKTARLPHSFYEFTGYLNRLINAADLRRLAIDTFCGNAELKPDGREIKPGVWAASGAVIHKRARVLAPSYIGAHARVRASAVVTRCSVLEHHAHIDCGTVVDNATVLPNTWIGAGLDVAHSVVGFKRLAHLGRNVELDISDPKLVGTVSTAPVRLLGHVASLASFLPTQMWRGFAGASRTEDAPSVAAAVQAPSPALKNASQEQFPANFAVVRRYGNE